jgi:electron transfer flavoprotein beta subunit
VLVSIGQKYAQEQLRTGLAMGADRHPGAQRQALEPLAVARVLAKLVEGEKPDLSSWASRRSTTTPTVPARCSPSSSAGLRHVRVEGRARRKSAKVTREVDGGLETLGVTLPAIVTADLRLNEPRYASLPGIMKARKKELKEIPLADLGVDAAPKSRVVKLETPPKRSGGRKVGSVQELVQVLHNEAKVI